MGEALVDAPIAAVGSTGSFAGGKALFDRAARRPVPIPVYAEMGSINPIVVTEQALRARADKIAEGLTVSVSSFGGQLCTKPGVVFVPAGAEGDAFAADLAARLDAAEPQVLLNQRLRDALEDAVGRLEERPEVRPLGDAPAAGGPGFRYQPAAYEAPATAVAGELLEEHFGPVVLLLRHGSREELLDAIGRIDGQLSGSLHAEPGEDVADVVTALSERAGRVVFNGYPTGVAVTFGMHHGGPYPATTSPLHTSVGMTAVDRFDAPDRVPGRAAGGAPAGTQGGQPAGDPPARRRGVALTDSNPLRFFGAERRGRASPRSRSAPACSGSASGTRSGTAKLERSG